MADKTVALSARLSAEDAAFLKDWEVDGADTPSEKLRRVVHDARLRSLAATDYRHALRMANELMAPALEDVRASELECAEHSELVAKITEWLPEMVAYVFSAQTQANGDANLGLKQLEDGVAMRTTTLMQAVLQMALTSQGPLYDPALLGDRLEGVLETARIVRKARASKI